MDPVPSDQFDWFGLCRFFEHRSSNRSEHPKVIVCFRLTFGDFQNVALVGSHLSQVARHVRNPVLVADSFFVMKSVVVIDVTKSVAHSVFLVEAVDPCVWISFTCI